MGNDDEDDEHGMMWEEYAADAVTRALRSAEVDDVRGTVTIFATDDHRFDQEFISFDALSERLIEIYDEQWYAYVPFDGGEAVWDSDSSGYVGDALADTDFEDFFIQIREPEDGEKILGSEELILTPANSQLFRLQLGLISDEVMAYFAENPQKLRDIDPDDFEKLMAAVFKNQGYDVTKTRASRDGGFDLILVSKSSIGSAMTLVDCKRYAEHKKVGIEIVRGLYGVVEEQKATSGMIVTTSSFTKGAVEFRDKLKYRMSLADFNKVKQFLNQWRRR